MSAQHNLFGVGSVDQIAGPSPRPAEEARAESLSTALGMIAELAHQFEGFRQSNVITKRVASLSRVVAQASHERTSTLDVRVSALERAAERRRPATAEERQRWSQFLVATTEDTSIPEAQRAAIHDTWQLLIEHEPAVMYPTAGVDDETGVFYFSWNLPRRSLEIQIAGPGTRSWFFADHSTGFSAESGEAHADGFLTFVPLFLRRNA